MQQIHATNAIGEPSGKCDTLFFFILWSFLTVVGVNVLVGSVVGYGFRIRHKKNVSRARCYITIKIVNFR